jgi:putative SOS response-associated peptidase YedK
MRLPTKSRDCFAANAGEDPWAGRRDRARRFAPVITTGREIRRRAAAPIAFGRRSDAADDPALWGVPPPPSAGDARQGIGPCAMSRARSGSATCGNSEFRCLVPATSFMEMGQGT